MHGPVFTDMFKPGSLTFIAIVACLALPSIPDFHREATRQGGAATANDDSPAMRQQPRPFPFLPEQSGPLEPNAARPARRALPIPANRSGTRQALDGPSVFYPELDRIAELEHRPADAALGELLPMLYDEVPAIRLAAIQSLGDMTIPAAVPALSAALGDPDPRLRMAALEALGSQGDTSAVSSIEPFLYDRERDVRVAAITALSDLESETAVHALAGLLVDQDSVIRRHAVSALGEIGGEYAMMYLLRSRHDPDKDIRLNTEAILREMEYEAAW